MAKFRNKSVVIEAEQWKELAKERFSPVPPAPYSVLRLHGWWWWRRWQVKTLEGWLNIANGDWLIQVNHGEYYPCKPAIFEATFEPVAAPEGR